MIFGEGKNISSWWRRKMEKDWEQNIWRGNRYLVHGGEGKGRNICFVEEKKSDAGKGGKYLEKEKYLVHREEEERRKKRG